MAAFLIKTFLTHFSEFLAILEASLLWYMITWIHVYTQMDAIYRM